MQKPYQIPPQDMCLLALLLLFATFTGCTNVGTAGTETVPTETASGDDTEIFIQASGEGDSLRLTVDHASIIDHWDENSYERGKSIYHSHCVQCHGENGLLTPNKTARAFGKDPFQNGPDPLSLWHTLTKGLRNMPAQNWLSPQARYDVIHYLREAIVKDLNPSQYAPIHQEYLKKLPVEQVEYRPSWNGTIVLQLFNGKDLTDWTHRVWNPDQQAYDKIPSPPEWQVGTAALDPENPGLLIAQPGGREMVNPTKGPNIASSMVHGDAIISLEVMCAEGSNSGIFLQGRYEIQVFDSYGIPDAKIEATQMGAIYGRLGPSVNAAKPPGQWNKFEINYSAPRFDAEGNKTQNAKILEVVLNGITVQEYYELERPTAGGLGEDEVSYGPLYLQGDHGAVAYRNIALTPIAKQAARNFGPALGSQLGKNVSSALTVRLPHDISLSYNLHRMKLAGAWQGDFLNVDETQHYRQRGSGKAQPGGPLLAGLEGWYWGFDGSLDYPKEVVEPRGPLPADWLDYHGHYLHRNRVVLSYAINGREILETPTAFERDGLIALGHNLRIGPGNTPLKLCVGIQNQKGEMISRVLPLDGSSLPGKPTEDAGNTLVMTASQRPDGTLGPFVIAGLLADTAGLDWHADCEVGCAAVLVPAEKTSCGPYSDPQDEYGGGQLPFQSEGVTGYGYASNVADQWNDIASAPVGQCPLEVTNHERCAIQYGFPSREFYEVVLDKPLCVRGIELNTISYEYSEPLDFETDPAIEYWDENTCSYVRVHDQRFTPGDWPTSGERTVTFRPVKSTRFRFSKNGHGNWWYIHYFRLLELEDRQRISLAIPPSDQSRLVQVIRASGDGQAELDRFVNLFGTLGASPTEDPAALTQGGPRRWRETLIMQGKQSTEQDAYVVDTIPLPKGNPWNAWLRTAALDFFSDGRLAVSTYGGDVYVVSGLDDRLDRIKWRRFATGLYEPLGLKIVDEVIYVTCRDRLVRLHDLNHDGEADFYENFYADLDVSSGYHAYHFDLDTDRAGNFYYAKTGRFTDFALPGALIKVSPDGKTGEIFCTGFRVPNGLGIGPEDAIYVSDNQGEWVPASKISLVQKDGFYGVSKASVIPPTTFDKPILWMPQEFDNSSGGQLWVDDPRWGPLSGRLLHTSFGKGRLCSVMTQEVEGVEQAAIVALPLKFAAGIQRARVGPHDGQVYVTGLTGWGHPEDASDGCLQRVRYTGEKARLLLDADVRPEGILLRFSCPLDRNVATNTASYQVQEWLYRWTPNYGSRHYSPQNPEQEGQDVVTVAAAEISEKGRAVLLKIPDLHPVDQLQIDFQLHSADGVELKETVYLTIHRIPKT